MTISSATNRYDYTGSGSTGPFTITDLEITADTQLKVIRTVIATGVETELTKDAGSDGYTVDQSSAPFTSITTTEAVTSLQRLSIILNVPETQATDYVENDSFAADTHESALDKLTLIAKQLTEKLARSIKLAEGVDDTDITIPDPTSQGEKYLKLNTAATAFEWQTLSSDGGLGNLVEDLTPQLGADLDANAFDIQFDDATGIRDDSDNEQLIFQKTASAVNHFEVTNAATGGDPKLGAVGDDTNVNLELESKGSGDIILDPGSTGDIVIEAGSIKIDTGEAITDGGGDEYIKFAESTTPVNEITVTNADTATAPSITATGDDTNIGLTIDPKGTGTLTLGSADATIALASTVTVIDDIQHSGDTDNKISFGTDTQDFQTGGSSRVDISDSGVRLGGANARVTTILDEDAMGSDSATSLATQQSIKAYVDAGRSGQSVQVVNTQDGAVATGTTTIPNDDTIPQNTEGDEYMTLAITPANSSNKLLIEVVAVFSNTAAGRITTALFQDSTADALAATQINPGASDTYTAVLRYYMTAGTVSSTTFKVRAGSQSAGTTTFNGNGSARKLGGVMASSITITEIKV